MLIRVTPGHSISSGRQTFMPNDVLELPDEIAQKKIAQGFAIPAQATIEVPVEQDEPAAGSQGDEAPPASADPAEPAVEPSAKVLVFVADPKDAKGLKAVDKDAGVYEVTAKKAAELIAVGKAMSSEDAGL